MREFTRLAVVVLAAMVLLPAGARAQGTITGTVKDTSGAVLPGVTVEVASPALIEKARSAQTDGAGHYQIIDLRPGQYSVTFTLTGFNPVKREGIEITGSFTASVNADLRVGALEETVTVTGESPIVDVTNAAKQQILSREIIDAIPSSRNPYALTGLIPGVTIATGQTVGGASANLNGYSTSTVHGSTTNSQVTMLDGISVAPMGSPGNGSQMNFNAGAAQEVVVDTGAAAIDTVSGGVRINVIPREGGNRFAATIFGSGTVSALQGSNLTQALKDQGIRTPDELAKQWDINPGFGGPIKQDRLWYYFTARTEGIKNYVSNVFYDRNANNPNAWLFDPDLSRRAYNYSTEADGQIRLTWQVSPRNKVTAGYHVQSILQYPTGVSAAQAVEASIKLYFQPERQISFSWTSPVTNRLLLEVRTIELREDPTRTFPDGLNPQMISVTEQSSGFTYRAMNTFRDRKADSFNYRVALSYVTGSHSTKIGLADQFGYLKEANYETQPLNYRFNAGIPNQLTMYADPFYSRVDLDHSFELYAQDRWTLKRLTLTYGLRFDAFSNHFPEQSLGPVQFSPTRNLTFAAQDNLSWKDLSPRIAATYDLFGNGKTALKVSMNKYLEGYLSSGIVVNPNPVRTLVQTTTRSWTDSNRNFTPDCNLLNPAAQNLTASGGDICAAMANPNFGTSVAGTTYDPNLLKGWGKRDYNWEFSAGVQHQLLPRMSVDVTYFRRTFGNFMVTDNLTVAPSDFTAFSITAPVDSRLPGGGGYTVSGLYDVNPSKFGVAANNYVTSATNYGRQEQRWQGFDFSVNLRPRAGLVAQGGVSTGTTLTDNCEIVQKLPEITPLNPYCHTTTPYLTQAKGIVSYLIPRVDVQVSGTIQSLPGAPILANFNAPNALIVPSLGRSLSGGAANATVNLVTPGAMYGDRLNEIDLRLSKLLRFGRTRTSVNLDFYNALNVDTALTRNNNFAVWQQPTSIVSARYMKIGAQFDF